jgi:hypothetical protein
MSETRIVNVASYNRIDSLVKSLESIIDQCDIINVSLNSHDGDIPEILYHDKVNLMLSDNSLGDAMKFYMLDKSNGYYLTIDDDLIYPPNYVEYMIAKCKEYGNTKVITLHGRNFSSFPVPSYYKSATERYSCLHNVRQNVNVQFGGTGVMCFHTDLFKLPIGYFIYPNMADVWIGKYCMENKIEILCVRHDSEYIKYTNQNNTIFDTESKRDHLQTLVTNSIFDKTIVLPSVMYSEPEKNLEDVFKDRETPIKITQTIEKSVKTINYDMVNQIFSNSPSHKSIKPKTITGNSTLKTNSSMINKLILSKKRR